MLAVVLALSLAWAAAAAAAEKKPKNVIVMIADGCGSEQYTLARWYKGAPLSFDGILVGAVKTWIADSVIADSAPTASAYATGFRTSDKFISVGPKKGTLPLMPEPAEEMQYRPLATVLEGARLEGMATGIVATSRVTHATPAAYIAHVPNREMENEIMEQAVYQGIDVVFGGGRRHLLPAAEKGRRADGENLVSVLRERGYQVAANREEMMKIKKGKAYGMFASSHMQAEIDRAEFAPAEPSLEEMTLKALELLSQSPKGFFLMVEASQIDWACHANDPAHLLSDMTQHDRAVKAALDFAKRDGSTLVIALSDHDTGGMRIGNYATSKTYSQIKLEQLAAPVKQDALLDPLKKMKLSADGMWRKMGKEVDPGKLKAVVKTYWGMDINDEDAARIIEIGKQYKDEPYYGVGEVLSARYTTIGWSSHGHTGGDVPLYAYGPGSPKGLLDGPEIGLVTAKALGLDLGNLNSRLFVEASSAFRDGRVSVDMSDRENPVVVIERGAKTAKLPVNKNLLLMDGKTIPLEGVVVYAPDTKKAYIPLQAVHLITGANKPLPKITMD
jgi:alkaline phosphatase